MTEKDLSPLREYIVALVARHIERREQEHRAPFMAFLDEILTEAKEDILEVLRQYVREGFLTTHKNVNSKVMFEFTPPK